MQRQERGLCLKFTYKSQSAVFKENLGPRALGRAEGISGAGQYLLQQGRPRLAASRGHARVRIPTAPQTGGEESGELCVLELEVGPLAVEGGTPRTHWKLECSYFPPTRGCGPRPAPS